MMKILQVAIGGFHGFAFLNNYYYWSFSEENYFRADVNDLNPRHTTVGAAEKRGTYYVSVRKIRKF